MTKNNTPPKNNFNNSQFNFTNNIAKNSTLPKNTYSSLLQNQNKLSKNKYTPPPKNNLNTTNRNNSSLIKNFTQQPNTNIFKTNNLSKPKINFNSVRPIQFKPIGLYTNPEIDTYTPLNRMNLNRFMKKSSRTKIRRVFINYEPNFISPNNFERSMYRPMRFSTSTYKPIIFGQFRPAFSYHWYSYFN